MLFLFHTAGHSEEINLVSFLKRKRHQLPVFPPQPDSTIKIRCGGSSLEYSSAIVSARCSSRTVSAGTPIVTCEKYLMLKLRILLHVSGSVSS